MINLEALAAGAALGAALVLSARLGGVALERGVYAVGLPAAAAIYLVFALRGGSAGALAVEGAGVVLYGWLAWMGYRGRTHFLAWGWATHVAWDFPLHGFLFAHAPAWYPPLCVGFDAVVAIRCWWLLRRAQETESLRRGM